MFLNTSVFSGLVIPQPISSIFNHEGKEAIATADAPNVNGPSTTQLEKKTPFFSAKQNEQCPPKTPPKAACEVELNSRLEVGGNYTYVTFQPHGHQSFGGSLGGMQALYEYRPVNRFYGGGKFSWRQGSMDGDAGKRSLLYFDVQERLGYTFASQTKDRRLTLYSGFGYRHHGQKLKPKEGDSLRFNYNEFYFPVGFLTNYCINSWFALGVDFTWMPQVYPTVSIIPIKGVHWTITSTLNNFYVEVPLYFTLTENKRFLIIVNPTYEHWREGHSTAKLSDGTALGLPGNTYNYYGLDINFAYKF